MTSNVQKIAFIRRLISLAMAFLIPFTSIAPSFAKNFNTWEELDSDRQGISDAVDPYMPVAEIGEACVDSFEKSPSYAGLANQLFIFPPHENDNSKEYFLWSAQSRKLQGEISNHSIDWTDLYWLRSEATQIYINQLIYNWRLQKEIFRHETHIDAGDMADFPEVQKGISYAADVRKKQQEKQISIPDAWNEKELIKHAHAFNSMVQEINTLCSESKVVYDRMMVVYNDSQLQNWETNEYLPILLGSQEENALVDGGIKGIIRKRTGEIRAITSWEAGLYTGVMSQTMFGKMYSAHNSALRNHVGTYNQKSCVEYGRQLKQLPETKDELWKLIGNSYSTVHHEFQKDLREVIENAKEANTQKILEDYVESNPTSIQQALWAKPSVGRAKSVCKMLQNFHESKTAKAALLEILAPITMLATFMTAGLSSGLTGSIIAYSALILNTYFIGSTVMDLVVSRDLEDRIQGALLSNQIDAATGEDMMNQLQASRPFSYLNIALSGLGAAAAVARLSKISKTARYKEYIDAKGGATSKKFAAAQEAYFGKQIKTGTLTRAKIKQTATKLRGPEPKGVKHDMGAETLRDYLKFAQNEADAGTGIVKTGPDTFIKPSTNPTGGAQGGGTSKVGTSSNGKPSIGGQRVAQSSKPVITKPSAIASTTSKTSGTNNAPINLVKTNPPKTSQSATTALIPQTKIYVEEDEPTVDPNVVPMPAKPDVVVPPVQPRIIDPFYSPGMSSEIKKSREKLEKHFQEKSRNDQWKKAYQAVENDLDEADIAIISIIEDMALEQSYLGKKARDWLNKHARHTIPNRYTVENRNMGLIIGNQRRSGYPEFSMLSGLVDFFDHIHEISNLASSGNEGAQKFILFLNRDLFAFTRERVYEHNRLVGQVNAIHGPNSYLEAYEKFGKQDGWIPLQILTSLPSFEVEGKDASERWATFTMSGLINHQEPKNFASIIHSRSSLYNPLSEPANYILRLDATKQQMIDELIKTVGSSTDLSFLSNIFVTNQLIQQYPQFTSNWIESFQNLLSTNHGLSPLTAKNVTMMLKQANVFDDQNQSILGRSHYGANASLLGNDSSIASASDSSMEKYSSERIEKKYTPQLAKEFQKIDAQYADMMKNLRRRDQLFKLFVEEGMIDQKSVDESLKFNHFQFPSERTPEEQEFNELIQRIRVQNEYIINELSNILENHGFDNRSHILNSGIATLEIIPTEKTKFHKDLLAYTKSFAESPGKKYKLNFNPIYLHNRNASLFVSRDNEITFGLNTVKQLVINEMGAGEFHEIRHLFYNLLKESRQYSLYHQDYHWDEGELVVGGTYKHFVSAEEIPAYANNLKIAIADFRKNHFEDGIGFAIESLYYVSKGILQSSHDFLTAIRENKPLSIHAGMGKFRIIEIHLPSGKVLNKPMVSEEERALFNSYLDDKLLNYEKILNYIYQEQLKLNHIAYKQVALAKVLGKYLDEYESLQNELIGKKHHVYVLHNLATQHKIKMLQDKIIELSLSLYQSSKETSPRFTANVEKLEDKYWPLVVTKDYNPKVYSTNQREVVIGGESVIGSQQIVGGKSRPEVASTASNSHEKPLYSGNKRVQNYNSIISDLKRGDVLDFGDGKKYEVDHLINSFREFFLVKLSDGHVLRIPEKNVTQENFLRFMQKSIDFKSKGILVLDHELIPIHGRYALHEKVNDYFGFQNLDYYQNYKMLPQKISEWKDIITEIDKSVVEWSKSTAKLAQSNNIMLSQYVYSHSDQLKKHQWPMIVTGYEEIVPYSTQNQSLYFQSKINEFADDASLASKMTHAVQLERKKTYNIDYLPKKVEANESIRWLMDHLPGFEEYHNDLVVLNDHSLSLNIPYYLEMFSWLMQADQSLPALWRSDFKPDEIEKIIKKTVDQVDSRLWSEVLAGHGSEEFVEQEVMANSSIQLLLKNYHSMDFLSTPAFMHAARTPKSFVYADHHFQMKIVSDGSINHLLYNSEKRRREMDALTATFQNEFKNTNLKLSQDTEVYVFKNEDVKYSSDDRFIIVRATKENKHSFFLFLKKPHVNDYEPLGKINANILSLLDLDDSQIKNLTAFRDKFETIPQQDENNQTFDYGTLESISVGEKNRLKTVVRKQSDVQRFYIDDPEILPAVIYDKLIVGSFIKYDLLYAVRSQIFPNNKKSCIIVVDTKHYGPSLDRDHQFLYNPSGYQINNIKTIDGTKYVFVGDRSEQKRQVLNQLKHNENKPVVSPTTHELAKSAAAKNKQYPVNTSDTILNSEHPYVKDSKPVDSVTLLGAQAYFNEVLSPNQQVVWKDVRDNLIRKKEYQLIDLNEVLVILYTAHKTGNNEPEAGHQLSKEKVEALKVAKNELYRLGYGLEDGSQIISRLSASDVMILGEPHSVENSGNAYGNEQFLDHLKFDVVDPSESRQNPLVLFRGLSTFYENTGVTQKELETFTRWVVERFSFAPFWGKNKHGNDWGYSYLQMWPKSNFANSNVGIQFDLVFLVNQKSEPFVVIRLPGHQKEVLYNFKDLVSHIDEFIQPNNLIPGRVYPENTYYSLITGAQYDTKEKTTWERDEYEDIPSSPVVQYIPKIESREEGSDHIQFRPSEPVSERIKNLGNKNSKASEFLQKLIGYEVTIRQLKSRPVVESGHFQSTRFLDFGPNEGYYYKIYQDSKVKKPFTNEVGDDAISEYELTDLEYAVYLADQKLNKRYPNVFLIEIDGKKVFFIKKLNEVLFNFKNLDGKVYKNKTKESMDELFKNFLAANILDVDQLKVVYKGSVNYSLPDDVVLFDFLLGIDDRHLTRNVLLSSDDIWNVVDEKFPLDISTRKYDLLIYDGGRAFSFEPNKMIQNGTNFFRWYGGYHYDYDQNMLNVAPSELKRLLINSPEFSNRLAQWTPDQIRLELHYLSDAHMTQFLQNRQFILDLALEAGVFAPTNNRPVPPAVLDDGAVAPQSSSTFDKEGSPSGGKGDELSPQYPAGEIMALAKNVVKGSAIFSQIQPESKRQMVRKEIDRMFFDKTSAYSSQALKWYEKNRIAPPVLQVDSPEVIAGKQFLDQWSQNNDQPKPSALIRSVIESFSITDRHPYQDLAKKYEEYSSIKPKFIVENEPDPTPAVTVRDVVQKAEKKTAAQTSSGPVWKVDEKKVDKLIKDATKGNKPLFVIEAYFKTLTHENLANYKAFDALVRPYALNEIQEKEILSLYRYIFTSTIPKTVFRDKHLLTFEHYFKIKQPTLYTPTFQAQFNQWMQGLMSSSNAEAKPSAGETFDKEGSPSGGKGDELGDVLMLPNRESNRNEYLHVLNQLKSGGRIKFSDGQVYNVKKFFKMGMNHSVYELENGQLLRLPVGDDTIQDYVFSHEWYKSMNLKVPEIYFVSIQGEYLVYEKISSKWDLILGSLNFENVPEADEKRILESLIYLTKKHSGLAKDLIYSDKYNDWVFVDLNEYDDSSFETEELKTKKFLEMANAINNTSSSSVQASGS